MKDLLVKLAIVAFVLYNAALGFLVVRLTTEPIVALIFISVDLFLTFYYVWSMMREKYKTYIFKRSHKELIERAVSEISKPR